jgi:hypothetical protein
MSIVTGATTTRRFISKSDETGGTTSNPDQRLDDLFGKIYFVESLFSYPQKGESFGVAKC